MMQHDEEQSKRGASALGRKFRLETRSNQVLVALNGSPILLISVSPSRARLFSRADNDRTRRESQRGRHIFHLL